MAGLRLSAVPYRRLLCMESTSGLRPMSLGTYVMLESSIALPRHWWVYVCICAYSDVCVYGTSMCAHMHVYVYVPSCLCVCYEWNILDILFASHRERSPLGPGSWAVARPVLPTGMARASICGETTTKHSRRVERKRGIIEVGRVRDGGGGQEQASGHSSELRNAASSDKWGRDSKPTQDWWMV